MSNRSSYERRTLAGVVFCATVFLGQCAVAAEAAPTSPPPGQMLPQGTFLYLQVAPWKDFGASWDKTSLAKICADAEVQAFLSVPMNRLSALIRKAFPKSQSAPQPPAQEDPNELTLSKILSHMDEIMPGPSTLLMKYSAEDKQVGKLPAVALIVGSRDVGGDVQALVAQLFQWLVPEKGLSADKWTRRVQFIAAELNDMIMEISGKGVVTEQYQQATLRTIPVNKFTFTVVLHRQHLILSSDRELAKQLIDGLAGTLPLNLAAEKTYQVTGLSGGEHLSMYLDVKGLQAALALGQPAPKIKDMLAQAGLDDLAAMAWSLRMNGSAFESRTALVTAGKRTGALGALDEQPISAEALRICRCQTPEAAGVRVKPEMIQTMVRGMISSISGSEAAQRFDAVDKKMAAKGENLQSRFAEAFTGEFIITRYSERNAPVGALSTEVGTALIKDQAKAWALLKDVMVGAVAERQPPEKFDDVYVEHDFEGEKICYLRPAVGHKGKPTLYAASGNFLLTATDMQVLKAALKDMGTPKLTDSPDYHAGLAASGGKLGSLFFYNDWGQRYLKFFDLGAKTLKLAAAFDLLRGPGIDVNMLPAPESITKHLFPSLTNVQVTENAVVLVSRGPLPSPEVVGPPIAATAAVIASFLSETKVDAGAQK